MRTKYVLNKISVVVSLALVLAGFAGCGKSSEGVYEIVKDEEEEKEQHWFLTKSETYEDGIKIAEEEHSYNESGIEIYSYEASYDYAGSLKESYEYEYNDEGLETKYVRCNLDHNNMHDENTTLYTYDAAGNLISEEYLGNGDVSKGKKLYEYDSEGWEIHRTEYDENENVIDESISEYDDNGNILLFERISQDYYKVLYQYDENGNEIQREYYADYGEGEEYIKYVFEYDDMNNRISSKKYDEGNALISTTQTEYYEGNDAVKNETIIDYDDEGKIRYQSSREVNEDGYLIESEVTDSDGNKSTSKNTFYKNGYLKKEKWKDEDGSFHRTYEYDEYGRCIESKKYKGLILVEAYATEYSEEGLVLKEIHTTTDSWIAKEKIKETREYTYNENGQLIKEVFSDDEFYGDGFYEYEYDADGNMILMSEKTKNGLCIKSVSCEYEYIA